MTYFQLVASLLFLLSAPTLSWAQDYLILNEDGGSTEQDGLKIYVGSTGAFQIQRKQRCLQKC